MRKNFFVALILTIAFAGPSYACHGKRAARKAVRVNCGGYSQTQATVYGACGGAAPAPMNYGYRAPSPSPQYPAPQAPSKNYPPAQ